MLPKSAKIVSELGGDGFSVGGIHRQVVGTMLIARKGLGRYPQNHLIGETAAPESRHEALNLLAGF